VANVVLFDDERSFVDGFRDDATVVRDVTSAEELFKSLHGESIDELWLDPTKRDELANKIEEQLQKAVNDRTEGDTQFFITGDVSIFKASPTDEFAKLYDDRTNAQAL